MPDLDAEGHLAERERAREGLFDAQLTFSVPFVEAPSPLTAIVKRDGTRVPFDKRKIAGAIFRAAESIGGTDRGRADSLASAVALYLAKTLRGSIPNVEQVDDAVERVLVEMGHVRTALVYAKCRERRARERSLRNGDTLTLLRELDEARRMRARSELGHVPPLLVRTSTETLASWDRTRIVEALTRETGLDPERAEVIALEVEQQILNADVRTLTAPLIRELVSAKLIEHGLESEHGRHRRLGVPLYDAERIMCGPSPEGVPLTPSLTSQTLAEAVKREFALSEVFSPETAEAHARGELHLHDLSGIDRLHAVRRSLRPIVRHGVGTPDSRLFSQPPKYPHTLLAQMVHATAILREHVAGPVAWDAANLFFAPFLDGFDQKELRQIAQMLVYEYAYRAVGQDAVPVTRIGLRYSVPESLLGEEAIGAGGQPTGIAYGGYASIARELAGMIYDVLREGRHRGTPFSAPMPELTVTDGCLDDRHYTDFFANAVSASSAANPLALVFGRDDPEINAVAHRITLNLPRAAYVSEGPDAFFPVLDRLIERAVCAHEQKRRFLARLLAMKGFGPLAFLSSSHGGEPCVDIEHAVFLIAVTGLNECVQFLCGREMHETEPAAALAEQIAAHTAARCAEWSGRIGFQCVPAATCDAAVNHRMAVIDLQEMPEAARRVVKTDPLTHDLQYTPGASANLSATLSPIARISLESRFHPSLYGDITTHVFVNEEQPLVRLASWTLKETRCRRLTLAVQTA